MNPFGISYLKRVYGELDNNSTDSHLMTYTHPEVFPCLFSNWRRCHSVLTLWTQGATIPKFICFCWHKVNKIHPLFVDSFTAQTQSVTAASGLLWWVLSLSESKPNIAGTNGVTVSVTTDACFGGICHCQRPLMELEPLSSFVVVVVLCYLGELCT